MPHVDPREVKGGVEAEALAGFMKQVGEITGKVVVLAEENAKDAVIARYLTDRREVAWTVIRSR